MSMDGRSSISMRRFKWLEVSVSSVLVFALAWCGNALAQTRTYQYEYRATVDDATKIEALSDQLFGDSVSYVDGGVEFHVTDIKAKTNGLLPVGFGRRVAPARSPEGLAMQGKIDVSKEVLGRHWEPDLPVISGIYQDNSYFVNGTAPGFYPANTDTSVKPHDGAGGVSCSRESVTARSSSVRLSA